METIKVRRFLGIISLMWLTASYSGNANPVRKTMITGGFEREYKLYVPQNELRDKVDGLLICLHGFGRTIDDFFEQYNISTIADNMNMIVAAPQALPEQDPLVQAQAYLLSLIPDTEISLHSVWGCGLRVKAAFASTGVTIVDEVLNKGVDDVAFIDLTIDKIISEYELSGDNIFMLGTSMGGYMTYQYALLKGQRLSGIIPIAGSFGLNIKGMDKAPKIPICDFHSVTDEVVPYAGSQVKSLFHITLAQPKEDVINFWWATNATGAAVAEQVRYYPSTNGITVEKIMYPDPDNEVVHYKVNGAPHSYFFSKDAGDCMDHIEEIMKFIAAHHSILSQNVPIVAEQELMFYPNPVYDKVYFYTSEGIVSIYDMSGRELISQRFTAGQTDLSFLKQGLYIIRIQYGITTYIGKLLKK